MNRVDFIIICLLFSKYTSIPQQQSTEIDLNTFTGINPIDFQKVQDLHKEELFRLILNPNDYIFSNSNSINDGKVYNWVTLRIALVYFIGDDFNINFDFNFKHIINSSRPLMNVEQSWNQNHFAMINQDYSNNGINAPNQIKRTYHGVFVVPLPFWESGKLTVQFRNISPGISNYYFKSFSTTFSTCKPDCNECNINPNYSCLNCKSGYDNRNMDCTCKQNGNVILPWYSNSTNLEFRCYLLPRDYISQELDLCEAYGRFFVSSIDQNFQLNYCNSCLPGSYLRYSSLFPSGLYCDCPSPYSKIPTGNSFKCQSRVEKECMDYSNFDDDFDAISYFKNVNLNLDIKFLKDPLTQHSYYSVNLKVGKISEYHKVAYRLSIESLNNQTKIQNIYFKDSWINNEFPGINLNLEYLESFFGCSKTIISNTTRIWKCNVTLISFHPCKKFVYMNVKIPIEIGEGGVVKPGFGPCLGFPVNPIQSIPCIENNSCWINKNLSSKILMCEDQSCKSMRNNSYQVGETVWIKSSVGDNPIAYKQSVEISSLGIYDIDGRLQVEIPFEDKVLDGVDFENKPLFGFPIKITKDQYPEDFILSERLSISIVLRLDPVRILEDSQGQIHQYQITEPIMVYFNFDHNSILRASSNNDDRTEINVKIIFILPIALTVMIILLVIIYCIIKNTKNKGMKDIPISELSNEKHVSQYNNLPSTILESKL